MSMLIMKVLAAVMFELIDAECDQESKRVVRLNS